MIAPHLEAMIGRLATKTGVTPTGSGREFAARCPAHDDHRESLSVGVGSDGKLLIHCHAGCDTADVLRAVGGKWSDLFPKPPASASTGRNGKAKNRIVATYDYRDEQSRLLFQVVRFDPKNFRQRKPDGNGDWTWSVKDVRRVPYRLPELLKADAGGIVFIAEGERDCDNIAKLGHVATTNAGGAGKWGSSFAEFFLGRRVVILPDNDDVGREHANTVAASLAGKVASVCVVELPGLPQKGDVSDWLKAGGTSDELSRLVEAATEWKPSAGPLACSGTDDGWTSLGDDRGRTDRSNARRFLKQHGDRVRFCFPWSKWLNWDGSRWRIDDGGAVMRLAMATADSVWHDAVSHRDQSEVIEFARATSSASKIAAMLKLTSADVPVSVEELDANPWLLNCPNGTVDLRKGELQSHRREDGITKFCPTNFNPEAGSHHFDRFLEGVFDGHQPTIDFMQRFFGYCLTGDVREQILAVFHGIGSNGKSTLLKAIEDTLGTDFSAAAPPSLLIEKKTEAHPTELAGLFGKRLVIAQETNHGARLAEATVKMLTGGDIISARRMREDFWTFPPTHKVVLVTNHRPRIIGNDHAIWRRLVLVPFARKFWNPDKGETGPAELRQDKALPAKLNVESEGILAWMVRGCLDWQCGGLQIPDSVRAATAEYRSEQDTLGRFVETCCIRHNAVRVKFSSLYGELERWCNEGGDNVPSKRFVGSWLKDGGFKEHTNNGRWYLGIALKAEFTSN